MGGNPRIYYPLHAVSFARHGMPLNNATGVLHVSPTGYQPARGVQSVSINTTFNLEQVFQLGMLDIYENIEEIPNVEMTVDKVIDGYALLEHLATPGASAATLAARYNDQRCMVALTYYDIALEYATGVPLTTMLISGAYVSAINWNIPVQGNITESITLVGNNKTFNLTPSGIIFQSGQLFTATETPVLSSGGVQRRENVIMASSLWPSEIPGIDGANINQPSGDGYSAHIQNVTIGVNLGRTELFELGTKGPYFRYAEFPTEVTTSIDITASEDADNIDVQATGDNLSNQPIKVWLNQGVIIDLGTKNKLSSVNIAGGDTGGGNVTVTYNYSTFNTLTVTSTHNDPAGQ